MIGWGIIGCGDVTERKSGPAFNLVQGSRLVAVMRRSGDKAADYARRHGVPRWYDDADRLLADPEVDAVYVATPPGTHHHYTLRALAAGKPVYVEKPMARNHREACAMVQASRERDLPLFVAYYRRALDRFVKTKELIEAGRLGRVGSVAVEVTGPQQMGLHAPLPWRVQPEHSGGGVFLDLASHVLDLVDFWFGPLEAQGVAVRRGEGPGPEDHAVMCFSTAGGVVGSGHFDFTSPVTSDRIVIVVERGRLALSTFGSEPVELVTPDGVERFAWPHPAHIQQPLIAAVVRALAGQVGCPSTGESAARTSAVMDRVLDSYYRGRDDEFWTRPSTWGGEG